ncbi:MAG: hypothetical protein EA360_05250 [Balneolaceae bacterium]|nr:MAG: hypothetical protein EA360_05250 [Balneolaceae bacterium]
MGKPHRNIRSSLQIRVAGWWLVAGFLGTLLHPMLHGSFGEVHNDHVHHAAQTENNHHAGDTGTPIQNSDDDCIECVLLTHFSSEVRVTAVPDENAIQPAYSSAAELLLPLRDLTGCQLRAPPLHS